MHCWLCWRRAPSGRLAARAIVRAMLRTTLAVLLLAVLPGCVVAVSAMPTPPGDAVPLLREKVAAAQRVVELRQRNLEDVRSLEQAGRAGPTELAGAESLVLEAQIRLLDARVELLACERLSGK